MVRPGRRASRLVPYLLLQALIAALSAFGLMRSLPQPPQQFRIADFRMVEGGVERPVSLPIFTARRYATEESPRFTASFVRPESEAGR